MNSIDKCTNCMACYNICTNNAIEMNLGADGFIYPKINKEKCINCGLCHKTCENIKSVSKNKHLVSYAVQSTDKSMLLNSSSGGIFGEFAKYILSKGGIVFGATLEKEDGKFIVRHISIDNLNNLYKIQGSKYVQSDIGYSYKIAKKILEGNRLVLFSGTPCQIAGLKAYLNKDYTNLLCTDLACHGVPSLKFFNDFITSKENLYKKEIKKIEFRNKKKLGWKCGDAVIIFNDNSYKILKQRLEPYLYLFNSGSSQRYSCYNCKFTGLNRLGDITLADCWGIEKAYPNLLANFKYPKNGLSFIMINTEKGKNIFDELHTKFDFKNVDAEILKKFNHSFEYPTKCQNKKFSLIYNKYEYNILNNMYKKELGWKYFYHLLMPAFIKKLYISVYEKREKRIIL